MPVLFYATLSFGMKVVFAVLLSFLVLVERTGHTSTSDILSATRRALNRSIAALLEERASEPGRTAFKISTKVFEAKVDVERGILHGNSSSARFTTKSGLMESIDLAVNSSSVRYARWALGMGLFATVLEERKSRRRKKDLEGAAVVFLEGIKKKITLEKYEKLMSINRSSTLMFAIDTTGSMREEIRAAQAIATAIVNRVERNVLVDYILSPFNDPGKI